MTKLDFRHKVFTYSADIFPMVFRILGNEKNAEDAIQEVMIKLWKQRKKVKNHPNIKRLVFVTARNYCIDLLRKNKLSFDNSISKLEIVSSNKSNETEWKELQQIIQRILVEFPENQREVFMMRDIDGYDFSEIASSLDITIEHARVLLNRARKKVRTMLEKNYHYEKGNY